MKYASGVGTPRGDFAPTYTFHDVSNASAWGWSPSRGASGPTWGASLRYTIYDCASCGTRENAHRWSGSCGLGDRHTKSLIPRRSCRRICGTLLCQGNKKNTRVPRSNHQISSRVHLVTWSQLGRENRLLEASPAGHGQACTRRDQASCNVRQPRCPDPLAHIFRRAPTYRRHLQYQERCRLG